MYLSIYLSMYLCLHIYVTICYIGTHMYCVSMFMLYIYILCIYVSIFMYYVYVSIFMYLCVCNLCMYVCVCICPSIHLSILWSLTLKVQIKDCFFLLLPESDERAFWTGHTYTGMSAWCDRCSPFYSEIPPQHFHYVTIGFIWLWQSSSDTHLWTITEALILSDK